MSVTFSVRLIKNGLLVGATKGETMTPLHELLSRIRWDPEFGHGEFVLGYLDKVRHELVHVPLRDVHHDPDSHFCFDITDDAGVVHSVPYHRVKEVWKNGALIWRRVH